MTEAEVRQLQANVGTGKKASERTVKPSEPLTPLAEHQAITDFFVLFRGKYWTDGELTSVDRINEQLRKNNIPLRLTKLT